ncbi:MAG TPA: carboxypeptidase regulatory-like domain-containing protein, partial [Blastocatellia bacterium]|nr:carboxypeptidase regulatory-like domain-containing protein [Blastocatellia bacterium]
KILIIAVLLLSVATHAQPPNPEANTASISGRVTLNGKPARHVNVTLVPGPYGSPDTPGRQKAKTDDEGRYQFKNLAAGRYGLVAASYINTSADLLESSNRQFKVRTVATGEEMKDVYITLVRGGVITGRITDADNQPVMGIRIELTYLDTQGKRRMFSAFETNEDMFATDDRGVYRLFGLPPGRYLVSVGVDVRGGHISQGNVRGYYPLTYYPNVAET